jgi:hypothetical protein
VSSREPAAVIKHNSFEKRRLRPTKRMVIFGGNFVDSKGVVLRKFASFALHFTVFAESVY